MGSELDRRALDDVQVKEINEAAERQLASIRAHFDPLLEEIRNRQITIDGDPIVHGVSQFNEKLAALRANGNLSSTELSVAISMVAKASDMVTMLQAALDEKIRLAITMDPDIKDVPGMEHKKLLAMDKHRVAERRLFQAKRIHALLKGYHDALKVLDKNIDATKGDLMKQLAVVKQMIALGEAPANTPIPVVGGAERKPTKLEELERELSNEFSDGMTAHF